VRLEQKKAAANPTLLSKSPKTFKKVIFEKKKADI